MMMMMMMLLAYDVAVILVLQGVRQGTSAAVLLSILTVFAACVSVMSCF
jgi:hypothetical protein